MRLISFNVNSVRTRLHQVHAVIDKHAPDIIGIQETKVSDEDFPIDAIHDLGYEVEFHGQKTHYGVAILSRLPFVNCQKGLTPDDAQKRFIAADFHLADGSTLTVANGYYPQGESRNHDKKFPNKAQFYRDTQQYVESRLNSDAKVILMGDLNVAPRDEDVLLPDRDKQRWLKEEKCSFLPEERDWFNDLCATGLHDTYRLKHENRNDEASWFDYRSRGFDRDPKRGLRIDFVLCSDSLKDTCTGSGIDYETRAMERPSDHCPVWADFDI